jgi:hypothetical protein
MADSPTIDSAEAVNGHEDVWDSTSTQHISLGGDFHDRVEQSRTLVEQIVINDKLRGRGTRATFYDEGFLKIAERRRNKVLRKYEVDLRYLDTVPTVTRHYPIRLLKITAGCGGFSLIVSLLAWFGLLTLFTVPAAAVGIAATVVAALWSVFLSHEKISFYTLHGRAVALRLGAGLGYIRSYHKLIPLIVNAIEEASENVGEDTMVYLRSEMREHYRLRGEGILSENECSDSTSRILAHFDEPL